MKSDINQGIEVLQSKLDNVPFLKWLNIWGVKGLVLIKCQFLLDKSIK